MRQSTRERYRIERIQAAGQHVIEACCIDCHRPVLHENQFEVRRALAIHRHKSHRILSDYALAEMAKHPSLATPVNGNVLSFARRLAPNRSNYLSATAIAHLIAMTPRKARATA